MTKMKRLIKASVGENVKAAGPSDITTASEMVQPLRKSVALSYIIKHNFTLCPSNSSPVTHKKNGNIHP